MSARPKIAFWHRYGPGEHAELFPAISDIVEQLSRSCEIHYFGMKSKKPAPKKIAAHAVIHELPFRCDRTNVRDKHLKTVLWVAVLPLLALYCRWVGFRAVFVDESVPLTALLARVFFGRNVAFNVIDMFLEIYRQKYAAMRWLSPAIEFCDRLAWRHLPLLFVRANATKDYLVRLGIAPEKIKRIYDPCDFSVYHPVDKSAARKQVGIPDHAVVLVHHGILHPNKGNDFVLRALAELVPQHPFLFYLLIGDGPEMPHLQRLIHDLNLTGHVRLMGWLPRPEDVNLALNAGDIGLAMRIGSYADHFHLTGALVHSMACGLPVLAARLAGMAEVVQEGRNGLLFDPADKEEFKRKLLVLAGDPVKRAALGQSALADARRYFDINAAVDGTVQPLLHLAGLPEKETIS